MVINRIFTTLYGIITDSLSTYYSCAAISSPLYNLSSIFYFLSHSPSQVLLLHVQLSYSFPRVWKLDFNRNAYKFSGRKSWKAHYFVKTWGRGCTTENFKNVISNYWIAQKVRPVGKLFGWGFRLQNQNRQISINR